MHKDVEFMNVFMPEDLKELYLTGRSRRYKNIRMNLVLYNGFLRAVEVMMAIDSVDKLRNYSFLHYEKLKHGYSGYSSVRLSNSYADRLIFTEKDNMIEIELIEIDSTHYGNRK